MPGDRSYSAGSRIRKHTRRRYRASISEISPQGWTCTVTAPMPRPTLQGAGRKFPSPSPIVHSSLTTMALPGTCNLKRQRDRRQSYLTSHIQRNAEANSPYRNCSPPPQAHLLGWINGRAGGRRPVVGSHLAGAEHNPRAPVSVSIAGPPARAALSLTRPDIPAPGFGIPFLARVSIGTLASAAIAGQHGNKLSPRGAAGTAGHGNSHANLLHLRASHTAPQSQRVKPRCRHDIGPA
jgi:hypothetical protein